MATRSELLEKLLGKKQAATAIEAVGKLDKAVEEAGIEYKVFADMDAEAVYDAIADVMKSDITEDDKRGAVVDLLKDLMSSDVLPETEEKAKASDDEEDAPPEDDSEDETDDEEEDASGKGLELVAKMVDDLSAVTEAQLNVETQFKALGERMDALEAIQERLTNLETVVTKALKARPRLASKDDATVVTDEKTTDSMEKLMTEYEVDPLFRVPVKKTGV